MGKGQAMRRFFIISMPLKENFWFSTGSSKILGHFGGMYLRLRG
jgi:hypothetical protein